MKNSADQGRCYPQGPKAKVDNTLWELQNSSYSTKAQAVIFSGFSAPNARFFFHLNISLHLFEMHCTFLPPFNPNLDFLHAVKDTKSGHLLHDWASKGYGSIPGLMSQTSLHACLQSLTTMQIRLWRQIRNRPMPVTSLVMQQMVAWFWNFYSL